MKWDEYEEAVKDIQQKFGSDAAVEQNVKIADGLGIKRQFDVVCRAKIQNVDVLYVTECKHRSRPVDMEQVEAFNQKANSVNANIKSIFSGKGFRKNALSIAKKYGINCYSISENGVTVDNKKVFGWHNFSKNVVVHLIEGNYETTCQSDNDESHGDRRLAIGGIDTIWFLRACVEKEVQEVASINDPEQVLKEKVYSVTVKPKVGSTYFMVSVGARKKRCSAINSKVKISPNVKMKFKSLEAKGIYDHHNDNVALPTGESIYGPVIDTHNMNNIFDGWDDATLEILKSEKLLVFWIFVPPIPKGFNKSRYNISVVEISETS